MQTSEYQGQDFSVRIEPGLRENVAVVYTRHDTTIRLDGELIGAQWQGIRIPLPASLDDAQVAQIVPDLQMAFAELRQGYIIDRTIGVDIVPEPERQAALAEMREMGYEIEIPPNGAIRLTPIAGRPRPDPEAARQLASRMPRLLQSVQGKRPRIQTLAKSSEF